MLWLTILLLLLLLLLSAIIYIRVNSQYRLMILASAPNQVNVGDKFRIDFKIVNHSKHDQVFEMLSLDKKFLDQFNFLGVLPSAKAQATALGGTGMQYQKLLNPGASMPVELHLEAITPGVFTGNFSAINSKLLTGKAAKAKVFVKAL